MNRSSIVIVAVIALALGFLASRYLQDSTPIQLESATWFGKQARELPEFELIDSNGKPFGKSRFEGKWNLLFFGYTHCPDVCPTTLNTLNNMMQAITDPAVRGALSVTFVSVDPERDKAKTLHQYVAYFNPGFNAATASIDKLNVLTSALGIAHQSHKKSDDDVNYAVDHSGAVIIINPAMQFAGMFGAPQEAGALARDLSLLITHSEY